MNEVGKIPRAGRDEARGKKEETGGRHPHVLYPVPRHGGWSECYARLERLEKKLDALLTLLSGK